MPGTAARVPGKPRLYANSNAISGMNVTIANRMTNAASACFQCGSSQHRARMLFHSATLHMPHRHVSDALPYPHA